MRKLTKPVSRKDKYTIRRVRVIIFLLWGYTTKELGIHDRTIDLTQARHLSMYLLYEYTDLSTKRICDIHNRKERGTTKQAIRNIERDIEHSDPKVLKTIGMFNSKNSIIKLYIKYLYYRLINKYNAFLNS